MVYIFLAEQLGMVKIGHTGNWRARLSTIRSINACTVEVIRLLNGGWQLEKQAHELFHKFKAHGEWYRYDPSMRECFPELSVPLDSREKPVKRQPRVQYVDSYSRPYGDDKDLEHARLYGDRSDVRRILRLQRQGHAILMDTNEIIAVEQRKDKARRNGRAGK